CVALGFHRSTPVVFEFVASSCEGLDPYSAHLTPNRLRDLYAMIDGNFVGLGVEVRGADAGLSIENVLPESPAEEAGLKAGDVIVQVDGASLRGMTPEEAANKLQGREGTVVRMVVERVDGAVRLLNAVRREVVVHSVVNVQMVDRASGVGYFKLTSFQKQTATEVEQAVERLVGQGMRSLLIDLRGNPGGLLDVAVQTANIFVDQGVIVSTQGRSWGQSWSHRALQRPVWKFPLILLVDGDSASASEILAGALQDLGRAKVVGTRTYGKGSVQSIFPLNGAGAGLRLTTAHFFSPTGRPYERRGVTPDVTVLRTPLGELGEESPLPPKPDLANDSQLADAHRMLRDGQVASAR
ncbi:MAG: S41 family peptidase, partial [Planctomycetia bacterium]